MVTALATILQSSEMLRNSRLADIGNIDAANAYNKHIYVHKSSTNKQNMQKKTSGIEGCLRCEKKLRCPNGEGSKLSTLLTSFVIPNSPYLDFVSKINRHYKVLNIICIHVRQSLFKPFLHLWNPQKPIELNKVFQMPKLSSTMTRMTTPVAMMTMTVVFITMLIALIINIYAVFECWGKYSNLLVVYSPKCSEVFEETPDQPNPNGPNTEKQRPRPRPAWTGLRVWPCGQNRQWALEVAAPDTTRFLRKCWKIKKFVNLFASFLDTAGHILKCSLPTYTTNIQQTLNCFFFLFRKTGWLLELLASHSTNDLCPFRHRAQHSVSQATIQSITSGRWTVCQGLHPPSPPARWPKVTCEMQTCNAMAAMAACVQRHPA